MDEYGVRPPRYRLPAATHVGLVRLQVARLERSIEYYERVLGLQVLSRTAGVARLGIRDDDRELVRLVELPGARPVPRRGVLGLYHFAILLPDRPSLGHFLIHIRDAGESIGLADHFVSEASYLTDPDGLGIEVYADRPRSMWRHDGRQLHMGTEPLDVQSVLAAAGDQRWTGLPRGTTMGHIHLHVGDLGRAADFYHAGLGFDKVVWGYPGALFMSAGGYHHHLATNTWSSGASAAADQARLLSWDLVVPQLEDASAASSNLAESGFVVNEVDRCWTAVDPWGTPLRVVAEGIEPLANGS